MDAAIKTESSKGGVRGGGRGGWEQSTVLIENVDFSLGKLHSLGKKKL